MTQEVARHARVMGRVQGVAYRAWTQNQAQSLGLRGWVHNNPDGSVSAFLIGTPEAVDTMLDLMWAGPGAAAVRDVTIEEVAVIPDLSGFVIDG
ncbi:acylphosphatase [Marinovum sp. 2_MG-2023]|uniref:acylphosphatase n=1 Tax=Roseobacteraceae TaxID=2854170 RepID=UPI001FD2E024|nr:MULTISPECIES: acylphosphatase [Roseobacteraceae]MCJ7871862.1 acylphosphatase [Phaeobacter sp. J2-8]MDO6728720.1 acylphosphatase [Marinovum sp. 2_MG-2023]MDO6777864.1 acylphosphatase [Marinovum sp. 1_MG-2023]